MHLPDIKPLTFFYWTYKYNFRTSLDTEHFICVQQLNPVHIFMFAAGLADLLQDPDIFSYEDIPYFPQESNLANMCKQEGSHPIFQLIGSHKGSKNYY